MLDKINIYNLRLPAYKLSLNTQTKPKWIKKQSNITNLNITNTVIHHTFDIVLIHLTERPLKVSDKRVGVITNTNKLIFQNTNYTKVKHCNMI